MLAEIAQASHADVYSLFQTRARSVPSNIAIECEGKELTYTDLLDRVDGLASALLAGGVEPGQRIAILSHNRSEYLELQLAAAAIGAIVACLNWRLAPEELTHCINLVDPVLVVVEPSLINRLSAISDLRYLKIGADWEGMIGSAIRDPLLGSMVSNPEAGLLILYTSGTTGLPKGALISHRAQTARAMAFAAELALDADDGFIAWAPLFHMASSDQALATLLRGGTVVVVDGFKPMDINSALIRHKIGWLMMLPGSIETFIEVRKAYPTPIKCVKICGAMADLVPPYQIAELTALVSAPYLNSFGSTETGLAPATAGRIQPGEVPQRLSKRISAFCEVKLVDEQDNEVADGEPGEMALRGPTLFSGYWNADETNVKDFRNGMFHMGDIFRRNPNGTIDFIDRAKYLIKTGGENVYPAEIERILLAHPLVSDAAVVKALDVRWGESPVAFVSRFGDQVTAEELMSRCCKSLAGYKLPREIRFIELEAFPRSTSGKIQRHVLEGWLETAQTNA
jgi:fatty-acyl-CoA synthase